LIQPIQHFADVASSTSFLGSGGFSSLLGTATIDAPGFAKEGWGQYLTNSIFVGVLVMLLVLWFVRRATKNMTLIPSKSQNLVEYVVEFLYTQVENIVGPGVAKRAFPLLATLFIYILLSNWFGLIPGVGTMGFAGPGHELAGTLTLESSDTHFTPVLRPPSGDLNMTLAIALFFMVAWFVITMIELGPVESFKPTFAPKGGLKGPILILLFPIFAAVGLLEIISMAFRPVSLSFRLFGNVFAGENLLSIMAGLGEEFFGPVGAFISRLILPIPFYFMEILVGLLQAVVFTLLCAVYINLSTTHEDHGDEHHEDEHHDDESDHGLAGDPHESEPKPASAH